MTNELEKQFFDTFGIEPKYKTCIFKYCKNKKEYDCENCNDREWHYPQITDHILLELICILRNSYYVSGENIEVLKERVLRGCIKFRYNLVTNNETIKQQVQTLFEEG